LLLELNDYQSTNEVIMTNTRELAKNISFGRAPATTSAGFEDFQKEMNKMSTDVYEKYEGNEYQYMMEFLPRFYKMLSHYDLA
jgi:hypothetical protein